MKQSILITGVSGSGKSSICAELNNAGYETYDLDSMSDVAIMIDRQTKQPVLKIDHHNDAKKIQEMDWIYQEDKLRTLIADQKNEIAFYCGIPSNLNEILPMFSKIILLSVTNPDIIRQRLTNRTSNDFGKSKEVQEWVLAGKDKLEKELREKGAILVSAEIDLSDTTKTIIEIIAQPI